MTGPSPATPQHWYVRPGVVLPIVAGLVILAALFAPERVAGRTGDARLTTYSTEPQGARIFYEMSRRLGWKVERRRTADLDLSRDVIHAVLAADEPLRIAEVHTLLEWVRQGGALFVILSDPHDPIGDSLHVVLGPAGVHPSAPGGAGCRDTERSFVPLWPDNQVLLLSLAWRGAPPDGRTTFLSVSTLSRAVVVGSRERPAAVGFSYGRGRIVVGSDPDIVRNDAIRVCDYGLDVAATHMLEYLSEGGDVPRRRIVFDEFHHGYGAQPGTWSTVVGFLGGTAPGRSLLQLSVAGLILLLALAPRLIPPRDVERVARRSPLEHVDALARAYETVGATRTATARLVRGLRRRVDRGGTRAAGTSQSDDAFFDRAEHAAPSCAPDVAIVRHALTSAVSRAEFTDVGAALRRIESSLTRL